MEAGLHTVLVLSGITQRDEIAAYPFRPNNPLLSTSCPRVAGKG
jgi:NagD protein